MKEISKVLELSEGRISQLLSKALKQLKKDVLLDENLFSFKAAA